MSPDSFGPNSPGQLVPVVFAEEASRDGLPRQQALEGFGFLPDLLPPKGLDDGRVIGQLGGALLEAGQALGALEARLKSLPNPMVLLGALRKREIQRSSQIEETIATIEELNLAEAGEKPNRAEVQRVLNNLSALRVGLGSEVPLGSFFVRKLHEVLMAGEEKALPGEYRPGQVYLGRPGGGGFVDARFVPPPAERVVELMDNLGRSMGRQVGRSVPWLVDLAVVHYQFEAIHPFKDGNGRMGRLLVNLLPARRGDVGLPIVNISEYLADRRREYYDALLGVSTRGDWGGWIGFFLRGVAAQALADNARAEYLLRLRESYYARFGVGASVLTHGIIDELFDRPVFRPAVLAAKMGVQLQRLMRHVRALEDAGIIRERSGRMTHQLFVAEELMRATEWPLDRLPPVAASGL